MSDDFSSFTPGLMAPASRAFDVTVSDTTGFDKTTRGIYVGTSGDLKVITAGGDTVTFYNLTAGIIHPVRCKQVLETGTDATQIIGVY